MLEHTSRLYHLFKGQLSLLAFQGFGQGLGFFFYVGADGLGFRAFRGVGLRF